MPFTWRRTNKETEDRSSVNASHPALIPLRGLPDASPPCDGCTRCCEAVDHVWLLPEEEYPVVEMVNGMRSLGRIAGLCMYLTVNGCSIHGNQPTICKTFDCRTSEPGSHHPEVVARGRQLRNSANNLG